ncbi:MAG: ribose-5-phosphate isomerase RpiA [SAR86 cluster bacterium]|jgi:ribose 5-phosphate isomerase A|nr:ribose-5-phosphate isomerase RpiA [SAR86 cluster bacterium]|tara:strand:+ start:3189 stop:3857 length:669 start_codon:yes stop_codon:yes gene_type:complete
MSQDTKKKNSAKAAFDLIKPNLNKDSVLGIGTGSTTNFFIEELNSADIDIKGAVCSSISTEKNLNSSIKVLGLNEVHSIDFYIDGADEFNDRFELIKGGGGALTREKILAYSSLKFICIVDDSKHTDLLGKFPLPIEVLEIARSAISREIMKMGGKPVYRNGFITDNGNQIIDVHKFPIKVPFELEEKLNNIPGVVENGIFSNRKADVIINAKEQGIDILEL